MAGKDHILKWSQTAASNTDIANIGIQGTNLPSNFDNASREWMKEIADGITRHVTKAAGTYTAALTDHNQFWRCTGAVEIDLTAAATLTTGWCLWVRANGGAVTIDPNGTENINGASASLVLADGQQALIICTGTEFFTVFTTGVLTQPTLVLKQGTAPTPTAEGDIQWDTDDDLIVVGNGTNQTTFTPRIAGTLVATTSGTSIDFTGIPSWAKRITVMLDEVSTNGTSIVKLLLGDSGGVETTGYDAAYGVITSSTMVTSTAGFIIPGAAATSRRTGTIVFDLMNAATFIWTAHGTIQDTTDNFIGVVVGNKSLSAALDRVRLTTVNGTDTFDVGAMNITWE